MSTVDLHKLLARILLKAPCSIIVRVVAGIYTRLGGLLGFDLLADEVSESTMCD